MSQITAADVKRVADGYSTDPSNSQSLNAEAYIDQKWFDAEIKAVFAKTWQWVCHVEKLREPGNYIAVDIAGAPIVVVRNREARIRLEPPSASRSDRNGAKRRGEPFRVARQGGA